ncbi:site-2 protease family protein [Alkaliphilus sp. B6464]|uniref:site-2 protease family protein n=1 Tax=Alkaliphilus sp. B6464 TaxID=2731219 RepID=UPI001BA7174F|nr:site-2 protease family protein [Alkaliphilus sp. B6464]QUH20723.1 site-2 protease family protein [Alkaliphilus sp. B6464]
MFSFDLSRILLNLPIILIAITLHEFAHAYSAFLLGDPTAKHYGRLTLNPISHIDITGFLLLAFSGFGWAKPVPINPNNFKNRKLGYFIVSIAGPISNILLAIIFTILLGIQIRFIDSVIINNIISYGIIINIVLAIFNLFPIPPLDGSKLLLILLPSRFEEKYYHIQKYSYIFLFILIYFRAIDKVLYPIVDYLLGLLSHVVMIIV